MSLIEKALEKMRADSSATNPANDDPAIPRRAAVVSTSVVRDGSTRSESQRKSRAQTVKLNQQALIDAGVIATESRQHQQISDYRHIKRHVLEAATRLTGAESSRLIMVTSALPGEGKTFTSVNLALSLALERDSTVLLIDGDVAKPNASRLLGIEALPGLLDALADDVESEDMVLGTNVPGLELMSAGRSTATATEFLSSARMGVVMQQLVDVPNRYVVIDSPPLLVTTEAAAMSKSAGQVVMVVRADFTLRRATQDALQLLGERDGVSLVLNRARQTKLEQYYYGYQYGAQYGDQPFPKALQISTD